MPNKIISIKKMVCPIKLVKNILSTSREIDDKKDLFRLSIFIAIFLVPYTREQH